MRKVRSGEVDFAVIVEGPDTSGLHLAPYRHDQLALVMRNDDALAKPTPLKALAFADLLDRDLVGLEGSGKLTRLLEAQAAVQNRPMPLRVQVRSFEAVCRAVQARLGIGVLPLAAVGSFAAALGLTVQPLCDAWALRAMRLLTRQPPEPPHLRLVRGSSLASPAILNLHICNGLASHTVPTIRPSESCRSLH